MGRNMGGQVKKIIDIVSYALELSVNGVTCVFLVHFRLKKHLKFVNWLGDFNHTLLMLHAVFGM